METGDCLLTILPQIRFDWIMIVLQLIGCNYLELDCVFELLSFEMSFVVILAGNKLNWTKQ